MLKLFISFLISIYSLSAFSEENKDSRYLFSSILWDLNGKAIELDNLKGRNVLINFWATWCGGCREEIPNLNLLRVESKGDYEIIGISADNDLRVVRDFVNIQKIKYINLIAGGLAPSIMNEIGNKSKALPFTVIIDKAGKITYSKVGPISDVEMPVIRKKLL